MAEIIKKDLEKILDIAGIKNFEINEEMEDRSLKISLRVEPEDAGSLIGEQGSNLQSLEHLLKLIAKKNESNRVFSVVLDINNYRTEKDNVIREMAKKAAHRVAVTKKPVRLSSMNAYERRLVHTELASRPDVTTESMGQEPERRVIIRPYSPRYSPGFPGE